LIQVKSELQWIVPATGLGREHATTVRIFRAAPFVRAKFSDGGSTLDGQEPPPVARLLQPLQKPLRAGYAPRGPVKEPETDLASSPEALELSLRRVNGGVGLSQ
jgi:hypothetical protein